MSRKKKKMVKLDDTMQQCLAVLKFVQSKPEASPFLEPVDWEFYGLTDYPEIIKTPMDLGTILVCYFARAPCASPCRQSTPNRIGAHKSADRATHTHVIDAKNE